ncbi:MAG TPA: hypothetical protein VF791_01830, partial [Pyrinomonadaceae bacterium]
MTKPREGRQILAQGVSPGLRPARKTKAHEMGDSIKPRASAISIYTSIDRCLGIIELSRKPAKILGKTDRTNS